MSDDILLKIKVDDSQVKKSLEGVKGSFSSLASFAGPQMAAIGTAIAGAFAISKVTSFFKQSAAAAMEAETATNAFSASLAQIGKYSKESVESFDKFSDTLEATTGISGEVIKTNAAMLVSLGKLSGEGLERATQASLDLSQALQVDTGTAFNLLSKAASGNVSSLKRYGITIDENIPKANQFSKALEQIEQRFGGLASTRLNTLEGVLTDLENAFGKVQEEIGKIFTQSPALREVIKFIATSFRNLATSIAEAVGEGDNLKGILSTSIQIGAVINSFLIAPIELFVRALGTGLATIKFFFDTLALNLAWIGKMIVQAVVFPISGLISGLGSLISLVDKDLGNSFQNAANKFEDTFVNPMQAEYEKVSQIQTNTWNSLVASTEDTFSFKMTDSINTWLANLKGVVDQAQVEGDRLKNVVKPDPDEEEAPPQILNFTEALSETLKGSEDAIKKFNQTAKANFQEIGKAAFQTVGRGVGQAFSAFGKAVATGENALQAFANSLLATMGDMAVQLGTQFILQGAAYMWAGLPNGPALITAGAALAAFGGILSGLSSGSSSSSSSGASNSSSELSYSPTTELTQETELERAKPDTSVSITIQGDVLDSDETGLRIAQLLSDAFDKKGVTINGAYV